MCLFDETARAAAVEAVARALAEDLGEAGDITSNALVPADIAARGRYFPREEAILAGGPVVAEVCRQVSPDLEVTIHKGDGERVAAGEAPIELAGPARAMLAAERTSINFLSHLSGVATLTRAFVDAIEGTGAKILDTRKTLPGLRVLQKYAVRCGGGVNHRFGLYDRILAKDNHLALVRRAGGSGSLADALAALRAKAPGVPMEVEARTLEEVEAALAAGADVIMLDNMPPARMRDAVALVRRSGEGAPLLEASGGITLDNVRAAAETGVDYISVGALTHSAGAIDISLEIT